MPSPHSAQLTSCHTAILAAQSTLDAPELGAFTAPSHAPSSALKEQLAAQAAEQADAASGSANRAGNIGEAVPIKVGWRRWWWWCCCCWACLREAANLLPLGGTWAE
jgi:hypothetical protein